MVKIYTLTDPRDNMVRYVGKTSRDPIRRFYGHWSCRGKSHSVRWVKVLKSLGLKPIMDVIDEVEDERWIQEEKFYISYFKFLGFNLTNLTEGGEGHSGRPIPKEVCDKIVASRRRNGTLTKPSLETRIKMKKAIDEKKKKYGSFWSPEERERIVSSRVGRKFSEKARQKMALMLQERNAKMTTNIHKFQKDGTFVGLYNSITQAAKEHNISHSSISHALRGKNPTAAGYIWKYAN